MKHTPGPWLIEGDEHGEEFEVYPQKDGPPPLGRWAEICTVKDYHGSATANAHLIAAAPDLLDAAKLGLQVAESWIHGYLDGTPSLDKALAELEPVRAVIAKAEGRS